MNVRPFTTLSILSTLSPLLMAITAGACGGEDPQQAGEGDFLPLVVGARWTYQVTDLDNGDVENKVSKIEALEDAGGPSAGTMAFRFVSEMLDGDYTVSWQQRENRRIVRYREESFRADMTLKSEEIYDPSKLRIDESPEHLVLNSQWTETYGEIHKEPNLPDVVRQKQETWTVEGIAEPVTTPAGTFATLRLRRNAVDGPEKIFWFARGVGKIKEVGGQLEELVSYEIPEE